MRPGMFQLIETYEKTVADLARQLAASHNAAEAEAGARMLTCFACNRIGRDQSCRTCELNIALARMIALPRYESAEHFDLA
jgi:hypothetical protein